MSNYDENAELRKADVERWICRLEINVGTGKLNGTGFLVNFRDSPKNLVMTAGHNIVQNKNRVDSVKVFFSEKLKVPNNTMTAAGTQLFVSTEYERDPENDIEDYGLIVFEGPRLGGLAFSALITSQTLRKTRRGVNVAGYLNGELLRAAGAFDQINDNQLSYRVITKQGISGGPVWVDYQRCDTVVGIHNYGRGQGKVLSGFRCTRLTKDIIMMMATWAGGFRLNTPITMQFPSESEKRYLKISSRSSQGGQKSRLPSALVCIPLQDDKTQRFDILPIQAPHCTKEVEAGEDDADWRKYIYVISSVTTSTPAVAYLGHTNRKTETPKDRVNLLRTWEWSQDDAAKNVGWILYRPKDRNGFHLLRTADMGKAASTGGEFPDNEIEVLAFVDTPMPPKTECGRRREIGCSEGVTFKSFQDKTWDDFPFNAEPDA